MKSGTRDATLHIFSGPTAIHAVTRAVAHLADVDGIPGQPLLVPSTGRTDDTLLVLVDQAVRGLGALPRRIVPATGMRSLVRGGWKDVELALPDLPDRRIRIAGALTDADPWIVCDVDAVATTGPFVLDVFSRHLHPVERLRQLADRNRDRRSAEVNVTVKAGWCILGWPALSGYLVAVTSDIIAAELFALSLSEEALDPSAEVTGPWEDSVVQRATELELGVLVPQHLRFIDHDESGDIKSFLDPVAGRMGVSL